MLVFPEDEFHDLILIDHVHGQVVGFRLRPEQRGAEHDRHVLGRHTIVVAAFDEPV